ncbi:MAG: GNAT family N-acetyltransferase [Gammaproteobacteria bacterium]|nr:GNAT family N-acetyltransferase [Gammaproteobacteria bacterium]MBU1414274.1 GNAT family N-acetyltransferase [Gammaproteobacteria bacterium]
MSNVRLRPVTEAELPLLTEILAELDGNEPIPVEDIATAWREMRRFPDYTCYLAESGGEIVGTLSMIVFPVLTVPAQSEAIVEAVVIRRSHRGRGLGRAMMRTAIELASAKGAYKLALSSNLRRLDAHRFYEGMGFTRHGVSFSTEVASRHG